MKGVHGKCKLETHAKSFCLQKAWHAQFLRKERACEVDLSVGWLVT
jgi:hypothetical protein